MSGPAKKTPPEIRELPNITIRQLEVFCMVCREQSYSNAAIELRSTRANVKRVCADFEKAVGRPLFEEWDDRVLKPTLFAQGLIDQVSPLSRALRRLGDCVRAQHDQGRILRCAAAGEFFKGGLFTDFLGRLKIADAFRPCFLRIETKRFRTAILNAECDVYFGVGITVSDRLEMIRLGWMPWRMTIAGKPSARLPDAPGNLPEGKWWIACAGDADESTALLDRFHSLGARRGRILSEGDSEIPDHDHLILQHDTTPAGPAASHPEWPCFQFSAVLRKHHPYSELLTRLNGAALL